jgi:hypothetical protein
MLTRVRRIHLGGLLFFVMLIALGCSGQEGETANEQAEAADAQGGDAVAQAEILTILAAADAADGTEDKVVSKCAGCKLGMDGSADYALTVENYEMHFCGADCKSHFADDTEKAVMALKQ